MKKTITTLTAALFAANAFAASSVQWTSHNGRITWADAQGDSQGPNNHGVELLIDAYGAKVTITRMTEDQALRYRDGYDIDGERYDEYNVEPEIVFTCWATERSKVYRVLMRAALGVGRGPLPFTASKRPKAHPVAGSCWKAEINSENVPFERHWQDALENNGEEDELGTRVTIY